MKARVQWAALALTAGCVSVTEAPGSGVSPPFNSCPAHPCSAYTQSGATPICNGGACLADSTYTDLVVVVSLSTDSFFAPGESFAIPYGDLFKSPNTDTCSSTDALPCTHLPGYGIVQGAYLASPQTQDPKQGLNWNLGNPGVSTALPVHVTYRPLYVPPGGSVASAVDADTVGLPLDVIPAFVVVEHSPSTPPGPGQGPSIGFQANIQPALYEATIQPDPPFDAVFPPDVKRVTIAPGTQNDEDLLVLDTTSAEGLSGGAQIPAFDLSRVGGLAGWTTYLRDGFTQRRISTLVTLGARTHVLLPTNHHPADGEALTGAELLIVPPTNGPPLPTYKVAINGGELPALEPYPTLAAPVTISGTVTDVDGMTPVEADLYFEAQSIYVTSPTPGLNKTNFEYTGRTSAFVDPSGVSTYSVTLPQGQYRLTARPLDAVHQITIQPVFPVDPMNGPTAPPVLVDALRPVQGYARIADGRYMAGAAVEAIPSGCSTTGSSSVCMPRDAQTTTTANGTFVLSLDPGAYVLRVRPQDGTGFPWVTQALLVGPTAVTAPAVTVPAPVHAGVRLHDPFDDPVVAAVVRIYQVPATGPAVEVASALTDATGTYDLLLAPSAQ